MWNWKLWLHNFLFPMYWSPAALLFPPPIDQPPYQPPPFLHAPSPQSTPPHHTFFTSWSFTPAARMPGSTVGPERASLAPSAPTANDFEFNPSTTICTRVSIQNPLDGADIAPLELFSTIPAAFAPCATLVTGRRASSQMVSATVEGYAATIYSRKSTVWIGGCAV